MKLAVLYSRDKGKCHYCRQAIPLEKSTADHKLPKKFGGGKTYENTVLSCFPCNNKKADMPYQEFLQRTKPRPLGIRKPDGKILISRRALEKK